MMKTRNLIGMIAFACLHWQLVPSKESEKRLFFHGMYGMAVIQNLPKRV